VGGKGSRRHSKEDEFGHILASRGSRISKKHIGGSVERGE